MEIEIRPGMIANKEQAEAIRKLAAFMENDAKEFMLTGRGGTGKTTIIKKALDPYMNEKMIGAIAIAGKAVDVLRDNIDDDRVDKCTVAKALGMKMNANDGKFYFDKNKVDTPIAKWDIIIVDEASMINEQAYELIMEKKKYSAKVIFMGDNVQLPPIRPKHSKIKDKDSPVFDIENQAKLVDRVRQGYGNPIIPITDVYANNVENKYRVSDPLKKEMRVTKEIDGKGVYFVSKEDFTKGMVENAIKGFEDLNFNYSKVICYRNNTNEALNNFIRKAIFGDNHVQTINLHEQIILNSTYEIKGDKGKVIQRIENGTNLIVNHISQSMKKIDGNTYDTYYLKFTNGQVGEVLHESSKGYFEEMCEDYKERALAADSKRDKIEYWVKFYEYKEAFMDFNYAYAINSHKSQGSTYEHVYVVEKDIHAVKMTSIKTKSQSLYVATSRASHKLFMPK